MKTKWHYVGDVNMLDYGGKNFRQSGKRQFQFVELINMDDACGRDNKGQPKYHVELSLVDLDIVPKKEQDSAVGSCGAEGGGDICVAEACHSYGTRAQLGQWSGNNARELLRQAYREANALLEPDALESALDKPVNKIGSTAREFMQGDIFSAMQRGVESGDPSARIMAKMYGVPQETIDDVRPSDFLPYLCGYQDSYAGRPKQSEEDGELAPEYHRGYERGLNVKAGKCPAPGWFKTSATTTV
jgi:hypothetical protein